MLSLIINVKLSTAKLIILLEDSKFILTRNINYFGHIISCKGWVNDPGNFNSTVAAGELAAMIYAIDPAMPDCNTAIWLSEV